MAVAGPVWRGAEVVHGSSTRTHQGNSMACRAGAVTCRAKAPVCHSRRAWPRGGAALVPGAGVAGAAAMQAAWPETLLEEACHHNTAVLPSGTRWMEAHQHPTSRGCHLLLCPPRAASGCGSRRVRRSLCTMLPWGALRRSSSKPLANNLAHGPLSSLTAHRRRPVMVLPGCRASRCCTASSLALSSRGMSSRCSRHCLSIHKACLDMNEEQMRGLVGRP